MSAADGSIGGTTKVVDHLANDRGWNLVILSDGYRDTELNQFHTNVDDFVARLQGTVPFDRVWDQINVFRVDVSSTDSGADNPAACGGDGAAARTFFDSSFCNSGVQRLLVADSPRVLDAAFDAVPEGHAVLLIVNSAVYGGSGGEIGVFSLAANAVEIGIHEMGHSAFGLADEYQYWADCAEADHDRASGSEPTEPNVTNEGDRNKIKWKGFIDSGTAVPTMSNPDCANCDNRASTVAAGTVGSFEGAHYVHCGAFRPEYDCKMRTLGQPFCKVCQDVIANDITPASVCVRQSEVSYAVCTHKEDQGYRQCAQTADQGYNACCTWWPCSWACAFLVWVSNIVCVAWTWVSRLVCTA